MKAVYTDVLIIGSGVAGLVCAEKLSMSMNVRIITNSSVTSCNSYHAQGGIAASVGKEDSWNDHLTDTLLAGAGHCEARAAESIIKQSKEVFTYLSDAGVTFDTDDKGTLVFGLEGGHRKKRILHAGGDQTGKYIVKALREKLINRNVFYYGTAADLIIQDGRCAGAWCRNETGENEAVFASYTILCTGGFAGLYERSSNVRQADGSGMAMAYRAGAQLCDLEFVQFHPTLLIHNETTHGLVSEAVRGEGGRLIDCEGHPIMEGVHPLKDLAPRDIVAREIQRSRDNGKDVFLDISAITRFRERFPTIFEMCQKANIHLLSGLLPVAPGAHFTMGGIKTDEWGKTSVAGLFAAGECARTGLHGANRLASNSLLEGTGMALRIARKIASHRLKKLRPRPFLPDIERTSLAMPSVVVMREGLSRSAGIVRDGNDMRAYIEYLEQFPFITPSYHHTLDELRCINTHLMAWLVTTSALSRRESRGGHYRRDYPEAREQWKRKTIERRMESHEQTAAFT
ncbi:L-aspartate oxidase [Fictibacillus iocasae]|uniref:L-aspartate oxidase n=1 Tax=Fictibacillus iocasae TaxID=2715437 RepID=A0ABW2NPC0_9BACL